MSNTDKRKKQRSVMITDIFKEIYKTKEERKKHSEILSEVIYQDRVLRGFLKQLTESELSELLLCKSAIQVSNTTKKYKYKTK